MEILLKAKQSGNPQFEFLSLEYPLHAYYNFILTAIKEGRHKLQEDPKEGIFYFNLMSRHASHYNSTIEINHLIFDPFQIK